MAWATLTNRNAGDAILASDQNITADNFDELAPFFSAWTAWTPTVTQSGTVTQTAVARYLKVGRLVIANCRITVSGTGTGGTAVAVSLPVAAENSLHVVGTSWIYDANPGTRYVCTIDLASTTTVNFLHDTSGASAWGASPNLALANADQIRFQAIYEAAS